MSIFDKNSQLFSGNDEQEEAVQELVEQINGLDVVGIYFSCSKLSVQELVEQINGLDGAILDDGEGGAFSVEVLPQMSYEDFVALCESLKRETI